MRGQLVPILLAIILTIGLSGCSSVFSPGADSPSNKTLNPTEKSTPTPPKKAYPEPPSNINNATAKEVALEYQRVWLFNQLRNESGLDGFGTGGAAPKGERIVNKSSNGIFVEVRYPYYYAKDDSTADVPSSALYFVNRSVVNRVNGTSVDVP